MSIQVVRPSIDGPWYAKIITKNRGDFWPLKDIVKQAGFRFDPSDKSWSTTDPLKALHLAQKVDDKDAINILQGERDGALEASAATDADIQVPVPDGLSLLPYQRAGIAYAMGRDAILIGDEMGLGKTVQAIGIANADPHATSILIIVPASLKVNWQREFQKWDTKGLSIEIVNGTKPIGDSNVVIINYDILTKPNHLIALRSRVWDLMIVDECHKIKSAKARRTKAIFGNKKDGIVPLDATRKVFLSGTPMVNRPADIWTLAKALDPDGLGRNWARYHERYCDAYRDRWGWNTKGASNLGELQERLRTAFMVRRLKKDVLKDLPEKLRQVIILPANGATALIQTENDLKERHDRLVEELAHALTQSDGDWESRVFQLREQVSIAFTELAKARVQTALAKIPAVVEHLKTALQEGPVVFICHHREVADRVREEIGTKTKEWPGMASSVVMGGITQSMKQQAVDDFQEGKNNLFIGTIQAAGVGLTLTRSSHVIFGELDWVPANVSQAEDRCHRYGQTETVLVQHIVLDGSVDAKMANTIISKQQVIDQSLDQPFDKTNASAIKLPEPTGAREPKTEEAIPQPKIKAIHEALQNIAGLCDGAFERDGTGFNKMDQDFGHSLANAPALSAKQAHHAKKLVNKYRRQVPADLMETINA